MNVIATVLFAAASLSFAVPSGVPDAKLPPSQVDETVRVGQSERAYRLFLPRGREVPVIIALHGKGDTPDGMEKKTGLSKTAAARGIAVAYPTGLNKAWGDSLVPTKFRPDPDVDVKFVKVLAQQLVRKHRVDPSRIYLAGMSNGANLALRIAAEEPGQFAGVAAVAGQLAAKPVPLKPKRGIPALIVYGTADPLRPYTGLPNPPAPNEEISKEPPIATIGTMDTARAFAYAAKAARHTTSRLRDTAPNDGTTVSRTVWHSTGKPRVELYTVKGGGHTWPGGAGQYPEIQGRISKDIDASRIVVDFFASKR